MVATCSAPMGDEGDALRRMAYGSRYFRGNCGIVLQPGCTTTNVFHDCRNSYVHARYFSKRLQRRAPDGCAARVVRTSAATWVARRGFGLG